MIVIHLSTTVGWKPMVSILLLDPIETGDQTNAPLMYLCAHNSFQMNNREFFWVNFIVLEKKAFIKKNHE